ncbi:MAG: hypothetical protein ABIG44_17290 [Planctomycetota bacterium]
MKKVVLAALSLTVALLAWPGQAGADKCYVQDGEKPCCVNNCPDCDCDVWAEDWCARTQQYELLMYCSLGIGWQLCEDIPNWVPAEDGLHGKSQIVLCGELVTCQSSGLYGVSNVCLSDCAVWSDDCNLESFGPYWTTITVGDLGQGPCHDDTWIE